MTSTQTETTVTEFALMVDHEDGGAPEYIAAADQTHAARMAETAYAGRPTWTVSREVKVGPWRFGTTSTAAS